MGTTRRDAKWSLVIVDWPWRLAYRVGFRIARVWWRLRRPAHDGAVVAVWLGKRILVVQQSYRRNISWPGGVEPTQHARDPGGVLGLTSYNGDRGRSPDIGLRPLRRGQRGLNGGRETKGAVRLSVLGVLRGTGTMPPPSSGMQTEARAQSPGECETSAPKSPDDDPASRRTT